ncbi:MAG: DUF2933 domain-containing protein [Chloroflexota bacterium]
MESKPAQNGISKHMLLMVLCCAIPLAVLAAVNVFRIDLGNIGYFAIVLLCPLMHIFMMRGMGHDHSSHQTEAKQSCHTTGEPPSNTADIPAHSNSKVPLLRVSELERDNAKVGIER